MNELPKNVRIATPEYEERIFQYLRILHAENSLAPMDEDSVRDVVHNLVSNKRGIVGLIFGEKSTIEASIGVAFSKVWYSKENYLEEMWNFVHPAHRKTNHAKTLLQFGKHLADSLDMPLLIGILSTLRTKAKIRLYERSLTPLGAMFIYDPHEVAPSEVKEA